MNNIRLIISDLDGTLLNENHKLSLKTIEVLKQAQQRRIGVVLTTGRSLKDLSVFGEQLDLSKYPLSGYITLNGLELYDYKKKMISKHQRLTFKDVLIFNEVSLNYDIPLILFYEKGGYLLNCQFIKKDYLVDTTELKKSTLQQIEILNSEQLLKIVLCAQENDINRMLESLDEQFYQDYEITRVESQWVEINPKGINKGLGIIEYLSYHHLKSEEIVVFGNGENDISMLNKTINSVVVENAFESVKKHANYLCESNINEGVAAFISKNIL